MFYLQNPATSVNVGFVKFNTSIYFLDQDSAATSYRQKLNSQTNSGWFHLCGVMQSNTFLSGYFNGTVFDGITNTVGTPTATDQWTELAIGNYAGGSAGMPTTMAVAEVAIWRAELSQTNAVALARGANPLTIRPGLLTDYFPLRNSFANLGSHGVGLSPVGTPATVWGDHPKILPAPSRRLFRRVVTMSRRPFIRMIG